MKSAYTCYRWHFLLHVINRKGKTYRKHIELHLGDNYKSAKWEMENSLKKKKMVLQQIISVKVLEIAFAFYREEGYPFVPISEYKDLPKPEIPEIL